MIEKSTFFYLYSTFGNYPELVVEKFIEEKDFTKKNEFEPSTSVINNILGFSDSYYPIKTKFGSVELMIN